MGNIRRKNGNARDKLRRRVLAAYSECALCGRPVDKSLKTPHPFSAEVDEIIPVSLGGSPTAWDNVQLAHRCCNQRKGNNVYSKTTVDFSKKLLPNSGLWDKP